MSLYSIALFVHISGAMLLIVLLAIEGFSLRKGVAAGGLQQTLGPITLLAILVPGFYMAAEIGWHPWTAVGLVTYVLIATAGIYTGVSVMRGRMSPSTAGISWLIRVGLAAGVVFDMTVKPDLLGSVAAIAVAVAIALAAVPTVRRGRSVA